MTSEILFPSNDVLIHTIFFHHRHSIEERILGPGNPDMEEGMYHEDNSDARDKEFGFLSALWGACRSPAHPRNYGVGLGLI